MEHHPDRNKGNKISEDKFKEINAANDIIGDSEKRKQYDAMRKG
ncbi:MAG: DnaJ domain [Candidatus Parcubacteria bacterium]|jgi:DnaJ-class molecular chaperone